MQRFQQRRNRREDRRPFPRMEQKPKPSTWRALGDRVEKITPCSRCGAKSTRNQTIIGYETRSDAPIALWGITEPLCPECREKLADLPVGEIQAFMGR